MNDKSRRAGVRAAMGALCLAGVIAIVSGCAYPIRNMQATDLNPTRGYRWSQLAEGRLNDTLVIVTASGGGTRATALTLSLLQGLQQVRLAPDDTLADEIDIISSVSGGSVTAGYFALRGTAGLNDLTTEFIRKDGIAALARAGLNPFGLAALATPSKERIDVLIDYLDGQLFHGDTYQALLTRGRRPYLILNAADMVEGVPFPLTQENLDLLCSDMTGMKLSVAVAASAAFPVALSPVTLKNYSKCPAQAGATWPPLWVTNAANTDRTRPENVARAERGRVALAYALGSEAQTETKKQYVHLLDGGIADNLGLSEPLRAVTTNDPAPGLLNDIADGRIKRIVFVVVNSRSFATSPLDETQATPSALAMLNSSIAAAIDQASVGFSARLRTTLDDAFTATATDFRGDALQFGAPELLDKAANLDAIKRNTFLMEVDFANIRDPVCRSYFHNIPTSWKLETSEIDALLAMGGALLGEAPEFQPMVQAIGGRMDRTLPSVASECQKVTTNRNP